MEFRYDANREQDAHIREMVTRIADPVTRRDLAQHAEWLEGRILTCRKCSAEIASEYMAGYYDEAGRMAEEHLTLIRSALGL